MILWEFVFLTYHLTTPSTYKGKICFFPAKLALQNGLPPNGFDFVLRFDAFPDPPNPFDRYGISATGLFLFHRAIPQGV